MKIKDLIETLQVVFEGKPWFGISVKDGLESIPLAFWDKKSTNTNNTIAALVGHMIDWRYFVIEKLKGNSAFDIALNTEADWRKDIAVKHQEGVRKLLEELKSTQISLCRLLAEKDEAWLFQKTTGKTYTNLYMIQGIVQHDTYHLGQINLLHGQLKNG